MEQLSTCRTGPVCRPPRPGKTVGFGPSGSRSSCVSADKLKETIVSTLTVADPTACDALGPRIDVLWNLNSMLACGDSLMQYWLVRREAIAFLMGCYAKQVDVSDGRGETHARSESSSRQDGWSQSQATSQGSRWGDVIAQARYADFADSRQDTGSQHTRTSSSFANSRSQYDDTGYGNSWRSTDAERQGKTIRQAKNSGGSRTFQPRGDNYGWAAGFRYAESAQSRQGFTAVLRGSTKTNTTSRAVEDNCSFNRSHVTTNAGRETLNDGYGDMRSKSNRASSSFFNAMVDSESTGESGSRMDDSSSSFRDLNAHSEGQGTNQSGARSKGEQSAQGTSKEHADGESARDSVRSSFGEFESSKFHQRFLHLKELHANASEMIAHLRMRKRGSMGVYVTNMLSQSPDGRCDIAVFDSGKTTGATCGCATK